MSSPRPVACPFSQTTLQASLLSPQPESGSGDASRCSGGEGTCLGWLGPKPGVSGHKSERLEQEIDCTL